jgi:hypothetical protein
VKSATAYKDITMIRHQQTCIRSRRNHSSAPGWTQPGNGKHSSARAGFQVAQCVSDFREWTSEERTVRRGAAMVEMAIVLSVFLLLVLGTMDLGIATYRYNTLSQAARQGVRQAVVHGNLAPPEMPAWGPATYNGTAGDGSAYAQAVSPMLVGFNLNTVTIKVEWPDGGNAIQQRARFTATTIYYPIVTSFFPNSSYTMSAVSTMPIAH